MYKYLSIVCVPM